MLEGSDYQVLDTIFPFVAVFIDHSEGYQMSGPMIRLHKHYNEIVCAVKGRSRTASMRQGSAAEARRKSRRVRNIFGGQVQRALQFRYAYSQVLLTISLGERPYDHFNLHIKQAHKRTFLKKRI